MTTTWRSPLSILMGARRNDDDDLELREDYLYRRSPAAAPPSPAAAAAPSVPKGVGQSAKPTSEYASYNPLFYLGFTSTGKASPSAAAESQNGVGNNMLENGEQTNGPPLGAFPPRLSVGDDHAGEEDFGEDREQKIQGDGNNQYNASHPWFNQVELTDPSHHENNQPNEGPDGFRETKSYPSKKKHNITWGEQKSIIGTTFNFTNSIIGAGAMGLGGAFAASGGLISIIMLIGFAYLTKQSLDMIIDLSSCPVVIRQAKPFNENEESEAFEGEISFEESENFSEGEEESSNISVETSNVDSTLVDEVLNMAEETKSDYGVEQPTQDDSRERKESYVGTVVEESAEEANDNSPLMAQEDGDQARNAGHALQTPTKSASPDPLRGKDRYDSLTMGVTEPKGFSPLAFKTHDWEDMNNDQIRQNSQMLLQKLDEREAVQRDNPQIRHLDERLSPCTYEELGYAAYGTAGRLAVLLSKALYSFGCLIAYVVVVRDNFGLAVRRMIGEHDGSPDSLVSDNEDDGWIYDDDFLAFWVSALVMLPLSCPRTMKPLAKFSFVSIVSIVFLVLVVIYLFFTCTNPEGGGPTSKGSFYENWIQIRSFRGFVESLGCFVFTFVCHHTVNLAYESLPMPIRNPKVWRRVSTNSIALALEASLAIGIFAYLTFGSQTPADVLMGYPADLTLANVARLLLCLTMVLTFPLPFLTCREMSVLIFLDMHRFYHINNLERFNIFSGCCEEDKQPIHIETDANENDEGEADFVQMQLPSFFGRWKQKRRGNVGFGDPGQGWWDEMNATGAMTQALLAGGAEEEHDEAIITSIGGQKGKGINPSPLSSRSGDLSSSESTLSSVVVPPPNWILSNFGDGRQLTFLWHAVLTFSLWLIVTIFAIKSPSLGDVLDLVGAFTGTLLAFVFPSLFYLKLKGYSHLSLAILGVGGLVGTLGTIFSFVKFVQDAT